MPAIVVKPVPIRRACRAWPVLAMAGLLSRSRASAVAQATESPLRETFDGVDHELAVFGWSEDFRVDGEMFAFARFASRSAATDRLPKQAAIAWGEGDERLAIPMKAIFSAG